MNDISVQYNKLIKRIKVNDIGFYKPKEVAYHLLQGETLNLKAINVILDKNEQEFLECLDNANNILDLNNE